MTIPQSDPAQDDAPLWRVIAEELRDQIAREVYPPGAPLPGETAMAERYHTSRPTVRRAIAELAGEGLLSAAQGRGTYVRPRPDRRALLIGANTHIDLFDEGAAARHGWTRELHPEAIRHREHGEQVTDALMTAATREQAEALRIQTGDWIIHRFTHWRHTKTGRVIAITSVCPAHLTGSRFGAPHHDEHQQQHDSWTDADPEPPEDDDEFEPDDDTPGIELYDTLKRDFGPVHFTTTVTARMPHGDEVTDLGTEPGIPLLVITRTMTDPHGRPLEATTIHAPADRIEALSTEPAARTPTAILTL